MPAIIDSPFLQRHSPAQRLPRSFFSEGVVDFPERLIEGYRNFRRSRLAAEQERYRILAETGQQPEIMVVGCCDSRVSPEVIFDGGPGELFVVRNVANLVPPYSRTGLAHGVSAALEFAVEGLRVRHIVVLGHARCGGIRAFATKEPPLSAGDFIGKWMSLISPAAAAIGPPPDSRAPDRSLLEYLTRLEQAAIFNSLANLMTFPFVRAPVEQGRLRLHAAYFDVATGALAAAEPPGDPAFGRFAAVAPA
jgi:carbonic anhydrase